MTKPNNFYLDALIEKEQPSRLSRIFDFLIPMIIVGSGLTIGHFWF